MIGYLRGKIIIKKERFVIVDVNDVGYKVFLSQKTLLLSKTDSLLKLFTYLNIGEKAMDLYGFQTEKELELFGEVNTISGIGPKVALEMSSLGSVDLLREKIISQDDKIFEGIPGLGKKRKMAIILAVSGKVRQVSSGNHKDEETVTALEGLGFAKSEIKKALEKIPPGITDTPERVTAVLKIIGK